MKEVSIITVSSTVGFRDGVTIDINGDKYKVKSSTATTLMVYKANWVERLKDWVVWKYQSIKWKVVDWYYDTFEPEEEEYNEDLD